MAKILIIDDEEQLRKLLARIIALEGYEVAEAPDCASGMKTLRRYDPDVVLCDVKLPDGNGVEMVGRIKEAAPATEVILLTAYGNIPDGVQAIKNGAFDYITKGDDNNKILPLLSRATEKAQMQRRLARLEDKLSEEHSFDRIIGSSESLRSAVALARKVAVTDTSVLLTGETGTGKEVFAQAIHHASPRAKGAFVAVNCSAFSKELLESELFGHRAGSFTGATKDKKGLFEEADKGTLFLDEIGEMPVELQAKLLRVLECGEFIKIGETRPTKVDLRIIAATNRDLEKEIVSGNFREDLFFRLSVFRIHLPSLRERPGDIAEYARFFAAQFADRMGRRIDTIDKGYIAALERHAWHGNVRELRNVVERSLIMAEGNALTVGCLSPEFHAASCDGSVPDSMALDALERHHILRVLEYTKGNKAEAARLLTTAKNVIIVPGYGMALAQAQHKVKQLADALEARGAKVNYAIHPVAGRMPGHMNVLLAEANVDYEHLLEMDTVNPMFADADLVVVVGANDVVNPAANTAEGTPIYGMPILEADRAKAVIICNYDEKPGYAGVDNPLYTKPGVTLLLGDAGASLDKLLAMAR